jgi:hypothetical protein
MIKKRSNTMSNKIFSHDEPAALAYAANQMTAAGYADEAQMIRRQPIDLTPLFDKVGEIIASLFSTSRDLPAALAYDANQISDAGYLPETSNDDKPTGLFENITVWIMTPAARRAAALRLVHDTAC